VQIIHGNNAGIVAQQKWAKKRVEYLNSLPKQQGLFQDEVIIHDKCSSGNSFINSILDASISANSRTLIW
jgi:hypothetical protein